MRTDRDAAAGELAALDTISATRLVRAFTTYFYLVNVAEQVHRGRELHAIRLRQGTWLRRPSTGSPPPATRPARSPPTCARCRCARSSPRTRPRQRAARVLTKIRRIASLLDELERAIGTDGVTRDPVAERRVRRRLEEMVDLLWQTDELRVVRPDVDRRGPQRDLLLRPPAPRRRPAHARVAGRGAGADRCRAAARGAPADLRHVDRRRPRRQPERHAGDDARRHRPPARPRHPRHARRDRRAAHRARPRPCGSPAPPSSSSSRWPPTSRRSPSSRSATGA